MPTITIDITRDYSLNIGSYGTSISAEYVIVNPELKGLASYYGDIIVGSGSLPDYAPTFEEAWDQIDEEAWTDILASLNANIYLTDTYVRGVIKDFRSPIIDRIEATEAGIINVENRASALETASPVIGDMKTVRDQNAADHGRWLKVDNRVLLQAEYPVLFAAIGTYYNEPGDNAGTEFRLPFEHPDTYDKFHFFIYADAQA